MKNVLYYECYTNARNVTTFYSRAGEHLFHEAGLRALENFMRVLMNQPAAGRKARCAAVAATVLLAAAGGAAAQDRHHAGQLAEANQYDSLYQDPPHVLNPQETDDARFHKAGTRGREGLGGSPFHPEGPGNVAD